MQKLIPLLLLTLATSSQAELIDLTTNQTISTAGSNIQQAYDSTSPLPLQNAQWLKKPRFNIHSYARCFCTQSLKPSSVCFQKSWAVTTKLRINEQGNIISVRITNSNAGQRIDRDITRSVKRAKLKPFKKNGVAIPGIVKFRINVLNPQYNPKLQCPVELPSESSSEMSTQ